MMTHNVLAKYVRSPLLLFWRMGLEGHFKFLPDELYLRICFRIRLGYPLDLHAPRTFNEKIQWLKLHDQRPEYQQLVDKLAVRDYIQSRVGEQYLIPLLGIWDRAEDVDFSSLPNQFVLKCTHDSGSRVICQDKSELDQKVVRKKLARRLRRNYFWAGREWPYKNVTPRIIAEQYIANADGSPLVDYKFLCFNGEPKFIEAHFDRSSALRINTYDLDWNLLPYYAVDCPNDPVRAVPRPGRLDEILAFVKRIIPPCPHVRVDTYLPDNRIYFSEFTFYSGSGFYAFRPEQFDRIQGDLIVLPDPAQCP